MKCRLMMIAWLVFTPWPLSATEALRVEFVEPKRYTDVGLSGSTTERIQTYILGELERYLKDLAANGLPPSHTLRITVFDLGMAGEYEPWRVPNLTNTRFIRDVYRPRIDLSYVWRDERGLVLAEQREQVSDLSREPQGQIGNRALREALASSFSLGELKQLCFDIGVDWEEIAGGPKTERIIELVLHVEKNKGTKGSGLAI